MSTPAACCGGVSSTTSGRPTSTSTTPIATRRSIRRTTRCTSPEPMAAAPTTSRRTTACTSSKGSVCHVLDPATGELLRDIQLPQDDTAQPVDWGFIGVYEDVLIGGMGFANYRERARSEVPRRRDAQSSRPASDRRVSIEPASTALVGFDRHTGEHLWTLESRHSFWHNGIVAGQGRDLLPRQESAAGRRSTPPRRGKSLPPTYRLLPVDAHNGETLWEVTDRTCLAPGWAIRKSMTCCCRPGLPAATDLTAEVGQGMAVYRGRDGVLQWRNEITPYTGPCILHGDLIITNSNSYTASAGAFRLEDGTPQLVPHPLTGVRQPWVDAAGLRLQHHDRQRTSADVSLRSRRLL